MRDITFVIPCTVLALWMFLAIRCAYLGGRIIQDFKRYYPNEAAAKIPWAVRGLNHPNNVFYFIRAESALFLDSKQDSRMLSLRARFRRSCFTILYFHLGCMLVIASVILLLALN